MIKTYTLKNTFLEITILNLGGIIHEIKMPDNKGNIENIVHGFKNIESYQENDAYFGALIGRTGGRIDKGRFTLNEQDYEIPVKDRGNALHGGINGFDKKYWTGKQEGNTLTLTCHSEDGEEGYPGHVTMMVKYTLEDDKLILAYQGTTDQDTLLNMTNHTYFNLEPKKTIQSMKMTLKSDYLLAIDETSIPTGERMDVTNTPFDFRMGKKIGQDMTSDHPQYKIGCGYDHPWLVNGPLVLECDNGRQMIVTSDQPCVVLYSYNFPIVGEKKHLGLAIEFQKEPNGINQEGFDSSILRKGEVYRQKTVYQFKVT